MRIGIVIVAYNAAGTLHKVLDRIPEPFRPRIERILISDDASTDATYLVGLGYGALETGLPITVLRQERNLGYGGNQKVGYRWAIEHGLDVVVLLHGDGQYAPELLSEMVAPIERGEADAVFGSRMMHREDARRGGMPLYKYVGNRILTAYENKVMGSHLTEWHSGYRAYSVDALARLPLDRNSDGFDFDTQVIVQLMEADCRIVEIPIPTFYGDEISHVNGLRYAFDICSYVTRYRLQKMGFGRGDLTFATKRYEEKIGPESSHSIVVDLIGQRTPRRVLDIGCGDGWIATRLKLKGHEVTGVDIEEPVELGTAMDRFVKADLDDGLPMDVGGGYDIVVAADVFEHLRDPMSLLAEIREALTTDGTLVASVPNVAHWYPRLKFGSGRFDYDRRGILDQDHLRFFTRRSFTRLAAEAGFRLVSVRPTGLPVEVVDRGGDTPQPGQRPRTSTPRKVLRALDRATLAVAPNLFAYQWVFELQRR